MTKVFQKSGYYLSLLTVEHCIFMRVEITCGVNEKQFVTYGQLSYNLERNNVVTYLNWKANRKKNTVKNLYNL